MKYGLVAFYDEEPAKFAAAAGFDGMEIFVGPVMDLAMGVDVCAMSDDDIKRIMDFLGNLGIGLNTLTCGPIHLSGDPVKRAEGNKKFIKAIRSR